MESPRFLCGQCNAGYKNKSSLRRHINVVHNQKRFVCNICLKDYSRNVDYIKHIVKMHQPIIMQQDKTNITNTPTTPNHKTDTPQHSIENTTAVLEGTTNWMDILKNDLATSSDEEEKGHSPSPPKPKPGQIHLIPKVNRGTSTNVQKNPETSTLTNTSPLGLMDLGPNIRQLITTHNLPDEAKTIFKVGKKPSTQIGCIPLIGCKTHSTQTEDNHCQNCTHQDHLIHRRQSYIRQDAINNLKTGYSEPYTSREERHRMAIPNANPRQQWAKKLQKDLTPKSPKDFSKIRPPPKFTHPEIRISSDLNRPSSSGVRRPSSLTIDNETYEAICSRKKTRPQLVTSPRRIFLPPPPRDGSWTYRTTKF